MMIQGLPEKVCDAVIGVRGDDDGRVVPANISHLHVV